MDFELIVNSLAFGFHLKLDDYEVIQIWINNENVFAI